MAKNSNNSLSDLNNEGLDFNGYVSKDRENYNNQKKSEEGYIREIEAQKTKRANAKDEAEIHDIDSEITILERDLDNLRSDSDYIQNLSYANSMFDKTAYVDYARVYNAKKNWKHYNSSEDKNGDMIFGLNNENSLNQIVEGDIDEKVLAEGLSIRHLVQWSEQYPALQLRGQDFAYCKNLDTYPNNRLIVLRRFKNGVPDNLFDYATPETINDNNFLQPLSTLINWVKPNQEFLRMNFNENWEKYESSIMETLASTFGKDGIGGKISKEGFVNSVVSNGIVGIFMDSLGEADKQFKQESGVNYLERNFEGNPNLIKSAKKRKTGGGGLNSKITFDLTFEYEMRYINGIDPGVAMLDLISNCMRMGTSTSEFRFAIPALKENTAIKKAIEGNFSIEFEKVESAINAFTEKITKTVNTIIKKGKEELEDKSTSDILEDATNTALKFVISRYRENLKAALSVDTGLESGIWHVTIGNPKNPIVSCGDLILTNSSLSLGKELGYNDFPNEFSIKYDLESARERGRDELERVFNCGRGRIYTYNKASNNPDYGIYDKTDEEEPKTTT